MKSYTRTLAVFALCCLFAIVSSRNVTWGSRSWNDGLLLKQNVFIYGNNWQPRPNFNLTYPARGTHNAGNRSIRFIQINDVTKYQNGGSPILLSGGIGFKYVNILLKSQTSNGLNLTAEIWGH